MKKIFTFIFSLAFTTTFAQGSFKQKQKEILANPVQPKGNFTLIDGEKNAARLSEPSAISTLSPKFLTTYKLVKDTSNTVIFIENNSKVNTSANGRKSLQTMGFEFLEEVKTALKINQPAQEFEMTDMQTDEQGQTHIRIQQKYNNIPVYGGELILHSKGEKIDLLNGRNFPTPKLNSVIPSISVEKAAEFAMQDVSKKSIIQSADLLSKFLNLERSSTELVIYHKSQLLNNERLTYKMTIRPNLLERWVYFVDANTGEILEKYNHTCSVDGVKTASARDLNGVTRTFSTYQVGSKYYMIDGSRSMFKAGQTDLANKTPLGAIWTIDGLGSRSGSDNPNIDQISSTNNSDWGTTGVSAHYNGGIAYDYYRTTFNRNSLDGKGGTIISVINIADDDGKGMDNAYWNGQFMAYGNGATAFKPLAGALDVAGHEMTHGVVDATAKLEYLSQSGAINESFADIFGAMIDRANWTIGEQVVKTNIFPSGALRSLQNPNQGGKGDNGYQPKTMSQYQFLAETEESDNGGVHINSGIPNYAFYLFASNGGVGKDKAEQVYYQALTKYLTRNSQFVDLRLAVLQSVKDKYPSDGNILTVAKNAFDAVGIFDPNGSTGNTTTPPTTTKTPDLPSSTGADLLLVYEPSTKSLYQGKVGTNNYQVVSTKGLLNKPSVQDDGSFAYYVGLDKNIYQLNLTTFKETKLTTDATWGNAAVSKDGKRLAALTAVGDKYMYIFNLENNKSVKLKLYNPTSSKGVSTGDVLYADSMEWDFSGENVVYDAFNQLKGVTKNLEYWDVGIIKAWDVTKKDFAAGTVKKLFSDLSEGENIGDPTFSKNSPDILAFDYFTDTDKSYYVIGVNLLETSDNAVGGIVQSNDIGYPNYSRLDDQLLYNAKESNKPVVKKVGLAKNKITPSGNVSTYFTDASWAVWYSQTARALPTKAEQTISFDAIPDHKAGDKFTVNATASSKLALQYTVSAGDATLSGNQVTAGTTAGKVKLKAFQLGNTSFNSASAEQSFCIIPAAPTASVNGTILTATGGSLYQWYFNGVAADSPTTSSSVQVQDAGNWTVKAVTSDGCFSVASNIVKVLALSTNLLIDVNIKVFPNPSADEIHLEMSAGTTLKEARLLSSEGKEMLTSKDNILKINQLPTGIYFLTIETNKGIVVKKIVRE